jgi:MoaA/NifB/PqqE/SkfB family radical SAM enzyme
MRARDWLTLPLRAATYAGGRAWPLWCTFAATDRCMSGCDYCDYWDNSPDELSTADCRLIIARLARAGVVHLILSGGEILLRNDVPEVVTAAKRRGLTVGINTSGVPGSAERYRRLMEAGLDRLTFSLDAAGAPVHDRLRPGAPWERVVESTRVAIRTRERGHFPTRIGTTTVLTRDNIHEIIPLVAFRKELGADWNSFQPVWFHPSRTELRERFGFTRSDGGVLREAIVALRSVTNGNLQSYYDIVGGLYGAAPRPRGCACFAGRAFVHVDSHGNLRPCSPLPFSFGSLRESDAGSLLNSPRARGFFRWADEGRCVGCSMTCYQERNLLLRDMHHPVRALRHAVARYAR